MLPPRHWIALFHSSGHHKPMKHVCVCVQAMQSSRRTCWEEGCLSLGSCEGGVLVAWPFKHGLANSGIASFCQDSTGFTEEPMWPASSSQWMSQQLTSERTASRRLSSILPRKMSLLSPLICSSRLLQLQAGMGKSQAAEKLWIGSRSWGTSLQDCLLHLWLLRAQSITDASNRVWGNSCEAGLERCLRN